MEDFEATRILIKHRVDSTMDPRSPSVILEAMIEAGHLPCTVLLPEVHIDPVQDETKL